LKLYVLNLGVLKLPRNIILNDSKGEEIIVPTWAALIKCDDGKNILFDTGCPFDKTDYGDMLWIHSEDETLENQLKLAGCSLSEIDSVIISHFHEDHSGNVTLFNKQDIYLPYENELVNSFEKDRICIIEKDFDFSENIILICFPGHTENLLGLLIKLRGKNYILPSDALYTEKSVFIPPLHFFDREKFDSSVEKLLALKKEYDAEILFSHDLENFEKMLKAPCYYE